MKAKVTPKRTVAALSPQSAAATETSNPTTSKKEKAMINTGATTSESTTPSTGKKPVTSTAAILSGTPLLQPPPAGAIFPTPPSGTNATAVANPKGIAPSTQEEAAVSAAVDDLGRFSNFDQLFGVTGLPYAQVVQCFDVGNQWTMNRNQTKVWDAYSLTQVIAAWKQIRVMMKTLKPVFNAALVGNPALATTYPGLAALFAVKKEVAKKAQSTKVANKAAVAAGLPASHGAVGKQRQTKAAKALLAASQEGAAKVATGTSPPPTPAGVNPSVIPSTANTAH